MTFFKKHTTGPDIPEEFGESFGWVQKDGTVSQTMSVSSSIASHMAKMLKLNIGWGQVNLKSRAI